MDLKQTWWFGSLIGLSCGARSFLSEGVRCGAGLLLFMKKGESASIHSENSPEVSVQIEESAAINFLWILLDGNFLLGRWLVWVEEHKFNLEDQ